MRQSILYISLLALCLSIIGCGQGDSPEPSTQPAPEPAAPEQPATEPEKAPPTKAPAEEPPPAEKAPPREPGAIPFENFPRLQTLAVKAGDYVLCPPTEWITKAFEKGANSTTFIYYTSTMTEPGEYQSKVKRLSGTDMEIPNAMIIPIKSGQTAKVGDILLTWWQSGSGMQRSIVVDGGSAEEPNVRHLDLDLDNPSGVGKRVDTLKANSFHHLTDEWQVGTAVACKSDSRYEHGLITATTDDKVLTIGFAGRMKVQDKASCVSLPIRPKVKSGQQVWVEHMGGFTEATVKRVDAKIGRVFAEYEFVGEKREIASPFGDVATKALP
jgi:hypothetical protein